MARKDVLQCKITVEPKGTIKDVNNREDLTLATDSQDAEAVKEYFGNRREVKEFDGFFVKVDNGDYSEVYGFRGTVPEVQKPLFKIERQCGTPNRREEVDKVRKMLVKAVDDEHKAAGDYFYLGAFAAGIHDDETVKLVNEIAGEEKHHEAELRKALIERYGTDVPKWP